MPTVTPDPLLLEAALIGLQRMQVDIETKIAALRSRLGIAHPPVSAETPPKPKRRKLSAAARRRIALAQKKRWAEYRKAKK